MNSNESQIIKKRTNNEEDPKIHRIPNNPKETQRTLQAHQGGTPNCCLFVATDKHSTSDVCHLADTLDSAWLHLLQQVCPPTPQVNIFNRFNLKGNPATQVIFVILRSLEKFKIGRLPPHQRHYQQCQHYKQCQQSILISQI